MAFQGSHFTEHHSSYAAETQASDYISKSQCISIIPKSLIKHVVEHSSVSPFNLMFSVFLFLDLSFLGLTLLPSYGHSPFVITCNSHKPRGFYALGLVSSFRAPLAFGPLYTDQGLPCGPGSRCLFNFCPQHFKIISQGLDCGHQNMNILRCTVTLILSSPPASGRQIMSPPVSCLSLSHINFSYEDKLIAHSWLLS